MWNGMNRAMKMMYVDDVIKHIKYGAEQQR